jgi:hypothetical protein
MVSLHLFGYIDPGSGTLLLQAILAACVGSLVCLRGRVKRVALGLFGRRVPADESGE